MPPVPLQLTVLPKTDTQGTPASVGAGMILNGLIRIKGGYIQKLGGCQFLTGTLHGADANILFPWEAPGAGFLIGIGTTQGLEISQGAPGTAHDITPVGYAGDGFWTLANWGDWLLSNYQFGGLYYWIPSSPVSSSGVSLPVSGLAGATGVPAFANGVFVAAPQQQAFAWGIFSATLGEQDPLLIGWCDIANLQDWTASATNQAGSFKLSSGSLIMAGIWFGLVGLFWTDVDLWGMQYINFPLVYGFQRIGQNCGMIGRQAWAILGTMVAWMGQNDFFVYQGGSVSPIPCPVRDFIFNTVDRSGADLSVHADSNSLFGEITWRFSQIGSSGRCNAYVKWTPAENAWDVWADPVGGSRTVMWLNSWSDQAAFTPPLGIDYNGDILEFEFSGEFTGSTVLIDYNGSPLDSFFVTGWFYISESGENIFVERVNPDFIFTALPESTPAGQVQITFSFADEIPSIQTKYPIRVYGPYVVTPSTPFIIVRGRGRVMQIRVDCTTTGTFWRNGKHMARITVDGSR